MRPLGKLELAVVAGLLVLAGGCAVGPNYVTPAAPGGEAYSSTPLPAETASADVAGGAAQRFVRGLDLPGQWWTLFHSAALNRLIEKSLKANPNLQAAEAALRVAMEGVRAQEGFYYPTVQANFAPSRQKNAVGTLSPTLTSGSPIYSLYTAQVSVSYMPDVFGLNRRLVESLKAQAESQRFQLEAAYLSLTSNVAAAAVQEASLRAQIEATEKVIAIQREQLEIFQRQFDLGSIAMTDVVAQQALLAQTLATLPALRKQLAQQRNLLAALAGILPSDESAEKFELATLRLPEELPLSLPSKLVEQRPDVRAAEEMLHAASAQIGVASANLLPQTVLTAAKGGVSTQIGQMFRADNLFWALAASVTQTVFDGGTLQSRKREAVAAFDQAAAMYRGTVITAFQNVADTLGALEFDAESLKAQLVAERATAQSLEYVRRGVELGSLGHLALLNAQQAYQQAVINLTQARASRFSDTVALFQAMGGGWWNRSDVDAAKSSFDPDATDSGGCARYDLTGAASMPWSPCNTRLRLLDPAAGKAEAR